MLIMVGILTTGLDGFCCSQTPPAVPKAAEMPTSNAQPLLQHSQLCFYLLVIALDTTTKF